MPISDAAEPSCVYLLINPLLSRPFYVGARPPGKHTVLMGMPPRDREICQKIMAAIREAGSRVQVAKVAFVPQDKAIETEAAWIGMLVRGAVDLVNHQVEETMRRRALDAHLASCREVSPAVKGKKHGPSHPGQGDLFEQRPQPPLSVALPVPAPVRDGPPPPEDLGGLPMRNGQPWNEDEVRLLTTHFLKGESVEQIAMRLERTPAAILAKLVVVASTRRDVKQRMLEIGLRRSGLAHPLPRPLPRDEAEVLTRPPYPPPNWLHGMRMESD